MNALVITLVVKASLLIGAVALADLFMRGRTSAASRHLTWTFAVAAVLLLPVLSLLVPAWSIPVRVASPVAVSVNVSGETGGSSGSAAPSHSAANQTDATIRSAESRAQAPGSFLVDRARESSFVTSTPGKMSWTGVALRIYAAGVAFLALHLLVGRWSLRRLVGQSAEVIDPSWRGLLRACEADMGVSEPVRLLRSLDRSMPMAFGVVTPTILIPAIADTWSDERRRAVLLHELAHIVRRDCFTQMLAALACGAYWMHPGVWWMARRLRIERELACDDRVLKAGAVARDYAAHLLELAYSLGGYRSPALVVSMARPRQLEGRMLAILDAARNRVSPSLRAYAIGASAMAFVVVPLAAAEAVMVTDSSERVTSADVASPVASVRPDEVAPLDSEETQVHARALAAVGELAALSAPAPMNAASPTVFAAAAAFAEPAAQAASGEERKRDIQFPGTWEVRGSEDDPGRVHLRLSERPNSMNGFMIAVADLDGLPSSLLTGGEGSAKFQIRRDAGTIMFDGVFRGGVGAGMFDFNPNPAFKAEMVKRGFESPNTTEQYQLARGNVGFAYLDELNRQKYERPTLSELVRASDHGVHLDYLREMGAAGHQLGQIGSLIRTRDHGVTPAYIRALAAEGYKNLTVDELVRAKDHGVSVEYVGTMRAFGYGSLPLDALIRTRDHGVGADYIRGMAEAGYPNLPLEQLVRARDHGVAPDFVKSMREAGYGAASLDELVNARDHGVGVDYVRGMTSIGPERPSLQELVNARDRGVSPEFAKGWRELGYPPVLADLARARDHGVSVEYIKELKALGYDRLPIDDVVRLRDNGVSSSFVREQNASSTSRLSVEQLVRRRNGRF